MTWYKLSLPPLLGSSYLTPGSCSCKNKRQIPMTIKNEKFTWMKSKDEDSRTCRISLHPVKYPSTYNVKLGVSQLGQYRTLQQTDKRKALLSFSVTKFQPESATSAASATISKNCSYRMFQDFHVKKCPILMFCNNSQQEMAEFYIFTFTFK